MINFLVVGISGTIGSALFSHLRSSGVSVYGSTYKKEMPELINVFYLDLSEDRAHWKLPDVHFDVIYLCAGVCRMARCEENPIHTSHVNITGMSHLVRHYADHGAFIIYLSTNQVFSGDHPYAATTSPYHPLNEYGRQKAKIEAFIQSYCHHFAILRLTKVIEKNMSLISQWIEQLKHNQPIDAFCDMTLSPISLRLVIETLSILGHKRQNGIYHLSGSHDISYYDLAIYVAKCLRCPPALVQAVSAMEKGIKKIFLPRFTTLDCSSTITLGSETPPHFSDVLHECFTLPRHFSQQVHEKQTGAEVF